MSRRENGIARKSTEMSRRKTSLKLPSMQRGKSKNSYDVIVRVIVAGMGNNNNRSINSLGNNNSTVGALARKQL